MADCIDTYGAAPQTGDGVRARTQGWFARLRRRFRTAPASRPVRSEPQAMLMATRDILPYIRKMARRFEQWEGRASERRRLMMLDDRMLKDIGISRAEAEYEFEKPFWR